MTKHENDDATYPVKTLHQFLSELDKEWGRFKRGALISIFISSMLVIALVSVSIRAFRTGLVEVTDAFFALILLAFLAYSIRLMVGQFRFFRKWEKRMTRLVNLEEKLMLEKMEDTNKTPTT